MMRRFLLAIVLVLAMLVVAPQHTAPEPAIAGNLGDEMIRTIIAANTFPPKNDRYFAYLEFNKLIPLVRSTGVITWRATDGYGWAAWHDIVARAYNTGSPYQFSYGNVFAAFVTVREARPGETPTLDIGAYDNGYVGAKCGGAFATACVDILSQSFPVHVYASAPKMQTYVPTGQDAVLEHEAHHPVAHACDLYIGGCPPTQGQPLQCTGNPETLMDCGLAARYPVAFDIDTFLGVYIPPVLNRCNLGQPAPCVGLDIAGGGAYVCGLDYRATIVSFAYDDGVQGDGIWFRSFEGSQITPGCVGTPADLPPGRCIYALQNNRVSYPALPYWQLAGCS